MEEAAKQNSFLKRITSVFSNFFGKQTETNDLDEYSEYTKSVKQGAAGYDDVYMAASLCKDALAVVKKRMELLKQQDELTMRISDLENFENLTQDETNELKKIIERLQGVTQEKHRLRGQLNGIDKTVNFLSRYEEQVPASIEEINEAEQQQRLLHHDISHLEGEKASLAYVREKLESSLTLIYRLSISLVIFYAVLASAMVTVYVLYQTQIFFYVMFLSGTAIVLGTILTIFRRRMNYELKINELLQNRAVNLLNKKRIQYARYTNFLNYEYEKFKVKNVNMLRSNWGEYGFNKHLQARHKNILSIVYEAENELEDFLKQKGINHSRTSIDRISKVLDVDNKKLLHRQVEEEKVRIDNTLETLDNKQEKIWKELIILQERDQTEEKVIAKILEKYNDDLEKLNPTLDKLEAHE